MKKPNRPKCKSLGQMRYPEMTVTRFSRAEGAVELEIKTPLKK